MAVTKIKFALGTLCLAVLLAVGAAAWGWHERQPDVKPVIAREAVPLNPQPEPLPPGKPAAPEWVNRTVRGIVRDEQGRPVAKAWFGREAERSPDTWELIEPLDRVRERKNPYRDEKGKIVPTGGLGKYFEMRDPDGTWRPVNPVDIRRYDPDRASDDPPLPPPSRFGPFELESQAIEAALAKGQPVFERRVATGYWRMPELLTQNSAAVRTDAEGNFLLEFRISTEYPHQELHFASPDFAAPGVLHCRAR